MTHTELVQSACRWLQGTKRCSVVFSEMATGCIEIPDAIGFKARHSVLVECKASIQDMTKDRKKSFRQHPSMGMGCERFFMVPPGLVTTADIPEGWGLLYAHQTHVHVVCGSRHWPERNLQAEIGYLCSMLYRTKLRAVYEHRQAGNKIRPKDFLNQWIKTGVPRVNGKSSWPSSSASRPLDSPA